VGRRFEPDGAYKIKRPLAGVLFLYPPGENRVRWGPAAKRSSASPVAVGTEGAYKIKRPFTARSIVCAMAEVITGFDAVRKAARDYETYSSDLLGDRDVRDYRQLPLEADPPQHTGFRLALSPFFMATAIDPKIPAFRALARDRIDAFTTLHSGDVVWDLALPYVIDCLSIVYDRPQDTQEWLSWGNDVWTAKSHQDALAAGKSPADRSGGPLPRSGTLLQAYLDRVFDEAEARRDAGLAGIDVWDNVCRLEVDGKVVNRRQMQGMANVLLAGGRDTVIKLISGIVWHLVNSPDDLARVTTDDELRPVLIAEVARYFSPLGAMERVLAEDRTARDEDRDPSKYVKLSFVSGNYDDSVFQSPDELNLNRPPRANLAFGFGPHACLGRNVAERETRAFLDELLADWPFEGKTLREDIGWSTVGKYSYPEHIHSLVVD